MCCIEFRLLCWWKWNAYRLAHHIRFSTVVCEWNESASIEIFALYCVGVLNGWKNNVNVLNRKYVLLHFFHRYVPYASLHSMQLVRSFSVWMRTISYVASKMPYKLRKTTENEHCIFSSTLNRTPNGCVLHSGIRHIKGHIKSSFRLLASKFILHCACYSRVNSGWIEHEFRFHLNEDIFHAIFQLFLMCFSSCVFCRDFRPTSMEKGHEKVRLRIYKIYAWGVPLIITGIAAILDNLPKSLHESVLRPRFGEKKCWFAGKWRSINTASCEVSCILGRRYFDLFLLLLLFSIKHVSNY